MKLLKEKDLLNWFKEMNISDYKKTKTNYYEIHYHFHYKGLKFSIISWEQYAKEQLDYMKKIGYHEIVSYGPMWEIYCFDVDNDIDRTYQLNKFKNFINQCIEMKGKK